MSNIGKDRNVELLAKTHAALANELDPQPSNEAEGSGQDPSNHEAQQAPVDPSPSGGGKTGLIIGAAVGALALGAGGFLLAGGGSEDGGTGETETPTAVAADAEPTAATDEAQTTENTQTTDEAQATEDTQTEPAQTEPAQTEPADQTPDQQDEQPGEPDELAFSEFEVGGVDALGRPIPALPETLIPTTPNASARPNYPDDPINAPETGPYLVIEQGIFHLRGTVASENLRQYLIAGALELIPAEGLVIEYQVDETDPWYLGGPIPTFLNDNILFAPGSNTIQPEFTPIAIIGTNFLTADPNNRIRIVGHTDNTGDAADNLELSRLRAETVAELYVSLGAPRDQLIVEAKGEAEPIADNSTEAGRLANRRVQFEVFSIN